MFHSVMFLFNEDLFRREQLRKPGCYPGCHLVGQPAGSKESQTRCESRQEASKAVTRGQVRLTVSRQVKITVGPQGGKKAHGLGQAGDILEHAVQGKQKGEVYESV